METLQEQALRIKNNLNIDKSAYDELVYISSFLGEYDKLSFGFGLTFIFDLSLHNFFYISEKSKIAPMRSSAFNENGGYKTIVENVHPDDILRIIHVKNTLEKYSRDNIINITNKLRYRLNIKLRILTSNNLYSAYSIQVKVMKLDNDGNVWLILGKAMPSETNDIELPVILTNIDDCSIKFVDFNNSQITNKPSLTHREKQLILLLEQHKKNSDISEILNISENTVKKYKNQLLKKLYVDNVGKLIEYAKLFCLI